MKKYLLIGAAAFVFASAANAGTTSGTLQDNDSSAHTLSYNTSSGNNDFEDAGPSITAKFTLKGSVTKTCAVQGVDSDQPSGLTGTVNVGTIGIRAGDELAVGDQFTMTGPIQVTIKSAAAGCNYNSTVKVTKDSALGMVNATPGSYDSNQFQANIPYAATASFTGVAAGAGAIAGTAQSVTVNSAGTTASGNFGAWRSPLQLDVTAPTVTGKGLVGGEYQGVVTLTISLT